MHPAIILLILGFADWVTTRIIVQKGGHERNPVAAKAMALIGFNRFLGLKMLAMAGAGYLADPWPVLWGVAAVIYLGVVANNVRVIRGLS